MSQVDPLEDLAWNEAVLEANAAAKAAMIALLVIAPDRSLRLVGTGFLITANGNHATAISAAHVFEAARAALHPNARHNATTPAEFRPPLGEMDLQSLKAIYIKGGIAYACATEIAIWDAGTDLAVFTIMAPDGQLDLFKDFFLLSNDVPGVGDRVALLGFRMELEANPTDPTEGTAKFELLERIGTVEEVFPERHFMLKGPALQTSIAVFSGMSGGLAGRWSMNGPIKPFGFLSHAPEPQSSDPKVSGQSVVSIPKLNIIPLPGGSQGVEMLVSDIGVGKDKSKSQLTAAFNLFEAER